MDTTLRSYTHSEIIRTERGLTIWGTRITIYDVMDYLIAKYPPKFIQSLFDLSEAQMNAALSYIETNWLEVETEYQSVLQQAEDNRQYWEERNRELIDQVANMSPKPGREALWEKLQAQKAQHDQEL
jgi:uncharacterized protein (DUF433 family)